MFLGFKKLLDFKKLQFEQLKFLFCAKAHLAWSQLKTKTNKKRFTVVLLSQYHQTHAEHA